MNKLLLLALVLVSIPSEGQSLKKLKVFCTDNFEPNSTVTVKPPKDDRLFLADALKNSLVMNGFKVISEKVAQEKLELINKKESYN
ncbi:MAG: hypothetical protein H6549_12670 [Chitinophagales bacterium]|nr:hypothetical protein [Chitinophagales bacterium]